MGSSCSSVSSAARETASRRVPPPTADSFLDVLGQEEAPPAANSNATPPPLSQASTNSTQCSNPSASGKGETVVWGETISADTTHSSSSTTLVVGSGHSIESGSTWHSMRLNTEKAAEQNDDERVDQHRQDEQQCQQQTQNVARVPPDGQLMIAALLTVVATKSLAETSLPPISTKIH